MFLLPLRPSLYSTELIFHEKKLCSFERIDGIHVGSITTGLLDPPSLFDLRINLNFFPEQLNHSTLSVRLQSRNGRNSLVRENLTQAHMTRIASAQNKTMTILSQWTFPLEMGGVSNLNCKPRRILGTPVLTTCKSVYSQHALVRIF